MNITPRIKSARSPNRLIVNFSIEIPLKSKFINPSYLNSQLSSPNQRKKYKLVPTPNHDKRTAYTSNLNTLRDIPNYNVETNHSRKKQTAPTPCPTSRGAPARVKSTQLSPKRKITSRRGRQGEIIRNISILQQVVNDQDNIIKYTTGSNELKDIHEVRLKQSDVKEKMQTHISDVDLGEIRTIQQEYHTNRDSQRFLKIKDILRIACAKKIQRAWRRYKTKKLIKSYSNDIRKKQLKTLQHPPQYTLFSARSQGTSLKLKKNTLQVKQQGQQQAVIKTERCSRSNKVIQKFQQQSIQKWQQMLQKIKNQKNIDKILEISLETSSILRNQLQQQNGGKLMKTKQKGDFFEQKKQQATQNVDKIIKTKSYYQQQRQKRREIFESKTPLKEEKVNYFENQMLKIENDLSDISVDSARLNSVQSDTSRQLQELENIKLRKKLQIFKQHLPQMVSYQPNQTNLTPCVNGNRRIDLNELLKKKKQQSNKQQTIQNQKNREIQTIQPARKQQILQIRYDQESSQSDLATVYEQPDSGISETAQKIIQTHREWNPVSLLQDKKQSKWIKKLEGVLKIKQQEVISIIFEQLVLESLIEISESEQLIGFIKNIYENSKKKLAKPQGIVTSHASIKDYLNYFINYIYEFKLEKTIQMNLLKPVGPTSQDVLKYFRGEELANHPDSDYVMSIKIFNDHWKYANDLIYFDPKFSDPKKESQRVAYLKQLTKVFFRAIFDCFNESLELQRVYGIKGKPYPWSLQKPTPKVPQFKTSLSQGFQRVLKVSTIFCGVHFADKPHNLDKNTMQEIQEDNMIKLIMMEIAEDEQLWNFFEDQLVQLKLSIVSYIQEFLLRQTAKVLLILQIKN